MADELPYFFMDAPVTLPVSHGSLGVLFNKEHHFQAPAAGNLGQNLFALQDYEF